MDRLRVVWPERPSPEIKTAPEAFFEVFGDEKAVWWERTLATWPDYADYQKTERQIPVFVLTPAS